MRRFPLRLSYVPLRTRLFFKKRMNTALGRSEKVTISSQNGDRERAMSQQLHGQVRLSAPSTPTTRAQPPAYIVALTYLKGNS